MAAVETNAALKEALYAQQQLLQKLYNELEVEREASATAASEALAMILRLQGEKAGVKMESEHYKRLAEEKMHHAEESMEIFEELINQKEMEIANLAYQVQAYRHKLSTLDIRPHDINEIETSPESLSRRNSAPPKLLKLAYMKRNRSASPDSDMIPKTVEEIERLDESHQSLDTEKPTDGINSYWDQIRKLDKIVEEMISDTCNLRVHDVFEVPETSEDLVSNEKHVKDVGKSILEGESKVEKVLNSFEKTLFLNKKEKRVFFPKDDVVVDCRMAVDVVEGEGSSRRVNTTTEITEGDVISQGSAIEMLRLLHEINKKLDSIQAEIRSEKVEKKKSSSNYDLQMLRLREAMLHFWL